MLAVIVFSVLSVLSCDRRRAPQPFEIPAAPLAAVPAAARAFYEGRCRRCHGPAGAGDGPDGRALRPPPRALRDRLWQSNGSTDHLRAVLVAGGGAVGKSPAMPAAPELRRDPALLDGMVTLVRALAERPDAR